MTNIEKLLKAIKERYETFQKRENLFGRNDELTRGSFRELMGLEEAFEIITGMTVVEYTLYNEFKWEE